MTPSPLTEPERRLLLPPGPKAQVDYSVPSGQPPRRIEGRVLDGETWASVHVRGVALRDVAMLHVQWGGIVGDRSTFDKVDVRGGTWSEGRFVDVVFRDCTFSQTRFEKMGFQGCRFERCQFDGCRLRSSVFDECDLIDCKLNALRASELYLGTSRLRGTSMSGSVVEAKFERVTWVGGALTMVTFEAPFGQVLWLQELELDEVQLLGGRIREAVFDRCNGNGVALIDVRARRVGFIACPLLVMPRLLRSRVDTLHVERSTIVALVVHETALQRLAFKEVELRDSSLEEVTLNEGGFIAGSQCKGFILRGGSFTRLALPRTTFSSYLVVERSRFWGLTLTKAKAVSTLKLEANDLRYENPSDRWEAWNRGT